MKNSWRGLFDLAFEGSDSSERDEKIGAAEGRQASQKCRSAPNARPLQLRSENDSGEVIKARSLIDRRSHHGAIQFKTPMRIELAPEGGANCKTVRSETTVFIAQLRTTSKHR